MEDGRAAEVAQGDLGGVVLALAQQGQVQGGGGLVGHQDHGAHPVVHQLAHFTDGGAEGGDILRDGEGQNLILHRGGIEHLLAQQALDGVSGRIGRVGGDRRLRSLRIAGLGDHHDVALNGVFHRGGVAAVVRVTLGGSLCIAAVQGDVALGHDALVLRGQIACYNSLVCGRFGGRLSGKRTEAHGRHGGQDEGGGDGLTAKFRIQNLHGSYPPDSGARSARSALYTNRRNGLLQHRWKKYYSRSRISMNSSPVMVSFW